MMERLRIGVAGCGAVARAVHLPLLQRRPDVQLSAVADSDPGALAEVVRRFHGVQPYRSLDDMLAGVPLDAVVVALPTDLHAGAARAVFAAGLHLFLEKPLAATLDDCASVVHAWRGSRRVGIVGFNCRANPLHIRLRELLRAGRAGATVYLRTVFATAARPVPQWKRQRATGGGALLDLGAHHLDLIRFLTGREITAVRATVSSRATEQDTALLELQLEGGASAHGFFSLAAAELDHVEVHGDAARLAVSRFTSLDVHIVDNPGLGPGLLGRMARQAAAVRHLGRALRARRSPLREPGYAILLDRFVQAARTGVTLADTPDIADGFACFAAIAAAELSVVTGRLETPALIPTVAEPLLGAAL
jgi:myo-inositol 2-dehydrogenase/D-chiro-inositol 1-dehydrogenase